MNVHSHAFLAKIRRNRDNTTLLGKHFLDRKKKTGTLYDAADEETSALKLYPQKGLLQAVPDNNTCAVNIDPLKRSIEGEPSTTASKGRHVTYTPRY